MIDDIEKDYLVDKLAGRLEEYFRIPDYSNQGYREWTRVWPGATEDVKRVKKEYSYWEWREETLAEYKQRKEQTE